MPKGIRVTRKQKAHARALAREGKSRGEIAQTLGLSTKALLDNIGPSRRRPQRATQEHAAPTLMLSKKRSRPMPKPCKTFLAMLSIPQEHLGYMLVQPGVTLVDLDTAQ